MIPALYSVLKLGNVSWMKDVSQEERWMIWMAQAREFSAKENFHEALGRASLVMDEVENALRIADTDRQIKRHKATLARVSRRVDQYRGQLEAWNAAIKKRYDAYVAQADDEMKRPLPLDPDFR